MSKHITLLLLLLATTAAAQVPSVTATSEVKLREGSNTWFAPVWSLLATLKTDSTFALAPGGGYAGKRITSNVYRTGKMSVGTTDTTGMVTIREGGAVTSNPALLIKGRTQGTDSANIFIRLRSSAVDSTEDFLLGALNSGVISGAGANTSYYIGHNAYPGGARMNTTKSACFTFWEDNFVNSLPLFGDLPSYEFHHAFVPSNSLTNRQIRFFSTSMSHDTTKLVNDLLISGDLFNITRFGHAYGFLPSKPQNWMTFDFYGKSITVNDSCALIFSKNGLGAGGVYQSNGAGSALLNLMSADASDRIVNGGTGVTGVLMPSGKLDILGTGQVFNSTGGILTLGTTTSPARVDVNSVGSEIMRWRNNDYPSRTWTHNINSDNYILSTPTGVPVFEIYDNAPNVVFASGRVGVGGTVQATLSITQPNTASAGSGFQLRDAADNAFYQWLNSSSDQVWTNGAGQNRMSLAQSGSLKLNAYTATSSFPVTAAGVLTFNSSGDIGTSAFDSNPSDDVTGSGVSGRVTTWSGTQTVTSDADWTFDGLNQSLGGSLIANGQTANLARFGSIAAAPEYPGIWFGDATPSFSNYSILWDNGELSTNLNAPSSGFVTGNINNSEIWRTTSTGLGIGTTPSEKLHVVGNIRADGTLKTRGTGTTPTLYLNNTTASTGKEWYINSVNSGDLVVGNPTTADAITVNGTTGAATIANTLTLNTVTGTGTDILARTAAGVVTVATLGSGLSLSGGTLSATGGGGGGNYQTLRDDGTDKTQRAAANFVSTATVAAVLTDDAGNGETEIALNIPDGAIQDEQLAATGVTAGSYTSANITVDADGRVTAAANGSAPSGTILQGGNSFGTAMTIGTNDAQSLNLEVGGVTVAQQDGTRWASYGVSTAGTSAMGTTFFHNTEVSGTPAAGFGGALEFGGESSTANYTSAAKVGWQWTTATHASRTSELVFHTVNSGTMAERMSLQGNGTLETTRVTMQAGTSAAGTAPLKFTSGTNLATPESGAVEFDGTNYYASASSTRYTLAKTLTATASLNFPSTGNGDAFDLTITVPGAASGDVVSIGVPSGSIPAKCSYFAWVSATNTVTVRFFSLGGTNDPASGTFRATIVKY